MYKKPYYNWEYVVSPVAVYNYDVLEELLYLTYKREMGIISLRRTQTDKDLRHLFKLDLIRFMCVDPVNGFYEVFTTNKADNFIREYLVNQSLSFEDAIYLV